MSGSDKTDETESRKPNKIEKVSNLVWFRFKLN